MKGSEISKTLGILEIFKGSKYMGVGLKGVNSTPRKFVRPKSVPN